MTHLTAASGPRSFQSDELLDATSNLSIKTIALLQVVAHVRRARLAIVPLNRQHGPPR